MGKRNKRRQRAEREPKPIRTAAPSRRLLALSPISATVAAIIGFAAALPLIDVHPAAAIAALVVPFVVAGLCWKRRTSTEWISLRRRYRRPLEQAILFERFGIGFVFDGVSLRTFLQLTPRAWQVTVIGRNQVADSATVPVDELRKMLVQGDIRLSRIVAVCSGHKYVTYDSAASTLDSAIGSVPFPLGGQTVIEAHLDVDPVILNAAYRRAQRVTRDGEPSLPDGICRTARAAAMRLSRHLARYDFEAHVMTDQQIRDLNTTNVGQLATAIASRRWSSNGDPQNVHTRSYSPARRYWTEDAAAGWNHVRAHRQFSSVVVTPDGTDAAIVQPTVTYLAADGNTLDDVETMGLHREVGQQVAATSLALPVSVRPQLRSTSVRVDDHTSFGFGVPAGGVGVFAGVTAAGDRVFVAIPLGGAGEPLWLCGPSRFARQIIARASTLHVRIAVHLEGEEWEQLVRFRRSPLLSWADEDPDPEVIVCSPQWFEMNRGRTRGRAVILVTEQEPGLGATHYLQVRPPASAAEEGPQIHLHVDDTELLMPWRLSSAEARALLGDQSHERQSHNGSRQPVGAR